MMVNAHRLRTPPPLHSHFCSPPPQFDPQAASKAGGALSSGLKASLASGSPSATANQLIPGVFSDEETKVDGKGE